MDERTATTCQTVTTPAEPPNVREVRCGRKLDAQDWCPKHGHQTPDTASTPTDGNPDCPECGGYGMVMSGSVDNRLADPCTSCASNP